MAIEKTIIGLTLSLFVSAFLISFFLYSAYGINFDTGLSLPAELPSYSSQQNFQSGSYDVRTFSLTGHPNWSYVNGSGLMLINTGGDGNYFLINNIILPENKIIVNKYEINNSVQQDYSVIIRYTGSQDNLILLVSSEGFRFPRYSIIPGIIEGEWEFIPYKDANKIPYVSLITEFHEGDLYHTGYIKFSFNGKTFTTSRPMPEDLNLYGIFSRYYGGIGSNTIGFIFKYFETSSIISGSGNSSLSSLDMVSSLIKTTFVIIAWNVPIEYLPLELNLLLIKTQAAGLLIAIAVFIRGNG